MQRIKIEVNDGVLDLFEGTDDQFYITKQLNDLHNLQTRQADFTRSFEIPSTTTNRDLLGLETNETFGNPSSSCNVLLDEILVIPYAKIIIIDHSITGINIVMFSGNFELFDNIPDKSIKDLDFATLNFPWSVAEIDSHKANTSNVLTAFASWYNEKSMITAGSVPGELLFDIDKSNFGFFFHCKDILDKILINSGYVLDDTDIISDDTYKDLVIACPVLADAPLVLINAHWKLNANWLYDNAFVGLPENVGFDVLVSDASALWDSINKEYVITTQGDYTFNYDYIFDFDNVLNVGGGMDIVKNGTSIAGVSIAPIDQTSVVGTLQATTTCQIGDAIYVEAFAGYKNGSQFDTITIYANSFFTLVQQNNDPTAELVVSDWLPDIKQRDFLINFLSIFNAAIDASPFTKIAKVLKWNDLITETAQDLSENVDARQNIVNELSMSGYYRESLMDYDSDSLTRTDVPYTANFNTDDSLPLSGSILQLRDWGGSDDSGNHPGVMEASAIEINYNSVKGFSIISASLTFNFANAEEFAVGDYIYYGGNRIDRINIVTSKTSGAFFNTSPATHSGIDVDIVTFNAANIKPRVGIVNRGVLFAANFKSNGYGTGLPNTIINLDQVHFNITMQYVHNTYYKPLFDALQYPKIVTVWMNFSVNQFINLDLLKPVFIQDLNGYFYINKIEQFKLNAPCRVELIRINKLI